MQRSCKLNVLEFRLEPAVPNRRAPRRSHSSDGHPTFPFLTPNTTNAGGR